MMWNKLKHEWKTFSFALTTVAVGSWEAARESGYDLTPLIPEKWRSFVIPGIGIGFLILRQWRDVQSQMKGKDVSDK